MRAISIFAGLLLLGGCGESSTHTGPPRVVVTLVVDPSAAKAVHLQVVGPGTNAFTSGGTAMLVESTLLPDRIAVAVFGQSVQGDIGTLTGVAPRDAGIVQVNVMDAVGADNLSLPPGTVQARVRVDTIP